MEKQEREFFDATGLATRPVDGADGVYETVLSGDASTGIYSRLLILLPGADTTPLGAQAHDFWEEVWILEGSLHDLSLNETFPAGSYACRPPGMRHGPWRAPEGCKTFEVRYRID